MPNEKEFRESPTEIGFVPEKPLMASSAWCCCGVSPTLWAVASLNDRNFRS